MGVEQRVSEERLQEIKDSIEFQYTLAKAKGYDNALLFTNEEEELVEEIERLNNIIKEVREYAKTNYKYYTGVNDVSLARKQVHKEYLDILKGDDK